MNHGAEQLRIRFPDRGGVKKLAELMGVEPSVACRWRSGERRPIARFRVKMLELLGVELGAWDAVIAVAPVPEVEHVETPVEVEAPRLLRTVLLRRVEFAHAKS